MTGFNGAGLIRARKQPPVGTLHGKKIQGFFERRKFSGIWRWVVGAVWVVYLIAVHQQRAVAGVSGGTEPLERWFLCFVG